MMMKLFGICLVVAFLCVACVDNKKETDKGETTPALLPKISVLGVLEHYPQNVKSVQAYLGHEFMVGDRPIIPTEKVPVEELKKFVGSKVTVKGEWNPGTKREPNEEEMLSQRPLGYEDRMVGAGLKASEIVKAK
jgi:hypothetical protein